MTHDDRAVLRRLLRLAALLCGDAEAAERVVRRALSLMGDPRRVEPALQDRVVVQEARRRAARPVPVAPERCDAAAQLAALPFQEREAWIMVRAYRLDPRDAARSMDCSRAATERHLARADAALDDDDGALAAALLAWSLRLEPPAPLGRLAARDRLVRRGLRWAAWVALAALVAVLAWVAARES